MKNIIVSTVIIFLTVSLSSCWERGPTQITMTTNKSDSLVILLNGSWGTATIDWGDGTTIKSRKYGILGTDFSHNYLDTSSHTITVTGSRLITVQRLCCFENQLTSLDVSKNPNLESLTLTGNQLTNLDVSKNLELTLLDCSFNQLTSLDVSNNTALWSLSCDDNLLTSLDVSNNTELMSLFLRHNQLSALALDALFETLHNNKLAFRNIYICGNPGADSCNHSIATKKGWIVNIEKYR